MITVENLTKRFARKTAIESVSFQVEKGEILGFLGPNGAGKTTTMRIITGFMPASDGTVRVDGFDVFENPIDVRRRIGYLPENPPLYLEMTVAGYLRFVAKIKGVPKEKIDDEIKRVMERASITDVQERIIAKLSKGYKQRVGVAQALIGDPPVLILDEPTIGLDPKQFQLQGAERVFMEIQGPAPEITSKLKAMPGVIDVHAVGSNDGRHRFQIEGELKKDIRSDLARAVVQNGWGLYELQSVAMSLEDIFLKLTTAEERE